MQIGIRGTAVPVLLALQEEIKDELTQVETPMSLDALLDCTIHIDNWLQELREERRVILQLSGPCPFTASSMPPTKPMQMDVGSG